jgi:hypothetical protein
MTISPGVRLFSFLGQTAGVVGKSMAEKIAEREKLKNERKELENKMFAEQRIKSQSLMTKGEPERTAEGPIAPQGALPTAPTASQLPVMDAIAPREASMEEKIKFGETANEPDSPLEWVSRAHNWINTTTGEAKNQVESPGVGWMDAGMSGTGATSVATAVIKGKQAGELAEKKAGYADALEDKKQKNRMELANLRIKNVNKIRQSSQKDESIKNALSIAKTNYDIYNKTGKEENLQQALSSVDSAMGLYNAKYPNEAIEDFDTFKEAGFLGFQVEKVKKSKQNVGDIINRGGKKYKVTGFDTDGEPLVDEVK